MHGGGHVHTHTQYTHIHTHTLSLYVLKGDSSVELWFKIDLQSHEYSFSAGSFPLFRKCYHLNRLPDLFGN